MKAKTMKSVGFKLKDISDDVVIVKSTQKTKGTQKKRKKKEPVIRIFLFDKDYVKKLNELDISDELVNKKHSYFKVLFSVGELLTK
jgi:hypothetical protein